MAIIDRTNPEDSAGEHVQQREPAMDEITPEAITRQSQDIAGRAHSAASNLPAALEPELRRIIDTAVARVATIELEAIREARELTQRSEVEAREALRFALDRAFNLINSLELLATTVNGMAEALKTELDDAITALRNVPEPESALARELAPQPAAAAQPAEPPAAEQAPVPEPLPEAVAEEAPAADPVPAAEPQVQEPEPQAEEPPSQEPEPRVKLAGLVRPAEDGAAQAERTDQEPQPELVTAGGPPSEPPPRRGRVRRFFTR